MTDTLVGVSHVHLSPLEADGGSAESTPSRWSWPRSSGWC